jgi:DNA-binding transcriptional ArsR family regulator
MRRKGGKQMLDTVKKETMEEIAELFKGFADPTRVHILWLLAGQELCVTEISEAVELSQSAISHQLRLLKQMHLVKFRRDGKNVLYSVADDHVRTILKMGMEHAFCEE